MKIAVFTGASSGIGREFARRIDAAEDFDEVWLIARREDRLRELAGELRAQTRVLPLDLTLPESFETYKTLLEETKPEIAVLVNAGGFGRFAAFSDIPLEEQQRMVDLNVKALMSVTYLSRPYLTRGSRVYQMGSMSSFQPVPWINVYGATKAFVLSFSRSLNREWKSAGIRVMAVCPLWVRTEFFDHAKRDDTISYYNHFYESSEVVTRALKDMKRGRDVSICGVAARNQQRAVKLLPHRLVMAVWCRQQKLK